MLTTWKNGKYQPLVKYVTLKDLKKLSNAIDIINGDSDTKGSIKKAIKDLVGEAPEAYDTLKEIADKLKSDDDLHKALNDAIILKASSDALNTEINRATSAETVNKNAIDGEVTRAKSAEKSLQDQITSNDSDITNLTAKHESLSRKVQGIAATGGASTATNVTYNNDTSGLNAENVQDAIDEVSSIIIYDVSAHNNGAVFESLQTLLSSSNLNTLIPISVRHGSMSIRFVQSSDNKYVQYRLMSATWSTTVADWQGVDEEPIEESNNLVKSGGVANALKKVSKIEKEIIPFNSGEKVSFTDDEETETYVEISSEGIKAKKYYFIDGTEVKLKNPYYILDASGNGDFTTVKQAISNVPKLGVVLVKPGEYSVKGCMFRKGQRFVGFTDSTECVFYINDGLYSSAPLVWNGYFENLSFESRHKASNTSRKAYSVHLDDIKRVQDIPFEVKFINCTFKSWNADCIGCGGAKDFKLYLENCRLYQYGNDGGTKDAPPSPACFAMHGAANMASTSQYAGPVYVYIKDSVLITYTKSALRFGYDRYTGTDNITIPGGGEWELINNSLYSYKDNNGVPYGTNCVSKGNTDPISSFPIDGTDWTLSPLNHGNNSQVININN